MNCQHKACNKSIHNKRNAVHADEKVFCSHDCFITYDLKLEKVEDEISFIRTRIGVIQKMSRETYALNKPHKQAEMADKINAYRMRLESLYAIREAI